MKRLLVALSVLVTISCSGAANAQFYAGVRGGVNIVQDSDLDDPLVSDVEAGFDAGFAVGGVAGYRLGVAEGLSLDREGEVASRQNDLDEFDVSGVDLDANGDVSFVAFMANAWLNWEIGNSGFAPYFGGGIGAVHVSIADPEVAGISLGDDESDTIFGGQIGAGLGCAVTEDIDLSLDCFLITDDPEFDHVEAEYRNHSVMLGFKHLF